MAMDPTTKAALWEELRFAKRQQWTITAAVVALTGGVYTIAHTDEQSLASLAKAVAAILIVVAVVAGVCWLLDLSPSKSGARSISCPPWTRAKSAAKRSIFVPMHSQIPAASRSTS